MRAFKINKAGDVELRLDDKHVLIIHAADEGVVMDVWQDGGEESLWSEYTFYDEMLPEDEGEQDKAALRQELHDAEVAFEAAGGRGIELADRIDRLRAELGEGEFDTHCLKCGSTYTKEDMDGGRCTSCGTMIAAEEPK